ncbi:uncharacterized protein A1O9_00156, partial [Exophiala aquamarina CBS 119918]
MKHTSRFMPIAALLAAGVSAQTSTIVNDPLDTGVLTVTYSVCPTALTTTTTLSSTLTFCGATLCNGASPTITPPPMTTPAPNGNIGPVLDYTMTGADGKVTVLRQQTWVYDQICSAGNCLEPATYIITETCPCMAHPTATAMPAGFTTTVVHCNACAADGGVTTVTLTTPCPTGPYATVTAITGGSASADSNAGGHAGYGSGSG